MYCRQVSLVRVVLPLIFIVSGCNSPYYSDRGTLIGGVGGAGVGALVGEASGHPGVGALVGAGVGAVTGNVIGAGMDNAAARNRAEIAARMGQPVPPGAVSINDVIAMTRSGVDEELIVNHIRSSGLVHPLQSGELIALQQQGVSKQVIQAMQVPMPPAGVAGGPPMMAQGPYYGPPPYGPYPGYYYPPPYAYPYPYPYPPPYVGPIGLGFSFRSGGRR